MLLQRNIEEVMRVSEGITMAVVELQGERTSSYLVITGELTNNTPKQGKQQTFSSWIIALVHGISTMLLKMLGMTCYESTMQVSLGH